MSARDTELEWAAQLSSKQTVGMNLGARNTPPATCAGQRERASRVSLLWARPSCGPTMCQSPAGHEQWGQGQPPGPWVKMAQGLCSPGPEGVPVSPICVPLRVASLKCPRGRGGAEVSPSVASCESEGGLPTTPEGSGSTPISHTPWTRHTLHRYPPPTHSPHTQQHTHVRTHHRHWKAHTHHRVCPTPHTHFAHAVCRHPCIHTYRCSCATDTHDQLHTQHVGHTQTHGTHTGAMGSCAHTTCVPPAQSSQDHTARVRAHTHTRGHAHMLSPLSLTLLILGHQE